MIVLDATTKSLEVKLSGAPSTQMSFVCSYVDIADPLYTPGTQDGVTNSTTAVTICAAPAAATQRQVKMISLYNADASSWNATIQYNDNATLRTIDVITLNAGDTLQYVDGVGFSVLTSSGQVKTGSTPVTYTQTTATTSGTAGGDLTGTYPNPTISTSVLPYLGPRRNAKVASLAVLTLSGTQTIDGVALSVGDRVLAMNQAGSTTPATVGHANNGVWVVQSTGWTRPTDWVTGNVYTGLQVYVSVGTVLGSKTFYVSYVSNSISVGADAVSFGLAGSEGRMPFYSEVLQSAETTTTSASWSTVTSITVGTSDVYGAYMIGLSGNWRATNSSFYTGIRLFVNSTTVAWAHEGTCTTPVGTNLYPFGALVMSNLHSLGTTDTYDLQIMSSDVTNTAGISNIRLYKYLRFQA